MTDTVDVVVVGAGRAGLAAAVQLEEAACRYGRSSPVIGREGACVPMCVTGCDSHTLGDPAALAGEPGQSNQDHDSQMSVKWDVTTRNRSLRDTR